LDNSLPFQLIVDFVFGRFVPIGFFENNWHLLILDGHGSHLIIEAFK
jgi:hypothetical protein